MLARNEFTQITSDSNVAERSAQRRLRMQRFRLLRFYVVGVVVVVGLAVWGVSTRSTAADPGTPQAPEAGTVVPSAANTEPSRSDAGASQASPTAATTDAAAAKVSIEAQGPKLVVSPQISGLLNTVTIKFPALQRPF